MFAHIRFIYLLRVFAGILLTFLFAVNEFNMFVECQACRAWKRLVPFEYEYGQEYEYDYEYVCIQVEDRKNGILYLLFDQIQLSLKLRIFTYQFKANARYFLIR